eukprot:2249537-Rhodomonas_salina.1
MVPPLLSALSVNFCTSPKWAVASWSSCPCRTPTRISVGLGREEIGRAGGARKRGKKERSRTGEKDTDGMSPREQWERRGRTRRRKRRGEKREASVCMCNLVLESVDVEVVELVRVFVALGPDAESEPFILSHHAVLPSSRHATSTVLGVRHGKHRTSSRITMRETSAPQCTAPDWRCHVSTGRRVASYDRPAWQLAQHDARCQDQHCRAREKESRVQTCSFTQTTCLIFFACISSNRSTPRKLVKKISPSITSEIAFLSSCVPESGEK